MLRPYSHLNYAWDEPSLPHKLVLSLPGNHVLGIFDLDKVGTPGKASLLSQLLQQRLGHENRRQHRMVSFAGGPVSHGDRSREFPVPCEGS